MATCYIKSCCDTSKFTQWTESLSYIPSCAHQKSWCENQGCGADDDDFYDTGLEATDAAAVENGPMSSGEIALITVGVVLIVGVIASITRIGFRAKKSNNKSQKKDTSGLITSLTTVSCVIGVIALAVGIAAFTMDRKSSNSQTPPNSQNNNLEVQNKAQLRTGPYKVKLNSMVQAHPFCQTNESYWKTCAELQEDLARLIDVIGGGELDMNETMHQVASGKAGKRTFVASQSRFTAVAPQLTLLKAKLNTPHALANTTVCTTYTPFFLDICTVQFSSIIDSTNGNGSSVLVAFVNPHPTNSRRARSLAADEAALSNTWHTAENDVHSGAVDGEWKGGIVGAFAGMRHGHSGLIHDAVEGAKFGAVKGAIEGGVKGGIHFIHQEMMGDAETYN